MCTKIRGDGTVENLMLPSLEDFITDRCHIVVCLCGSWRATNTDRPTAGQPACFFLLCFKTSSIHNTAHAWCILTRSRSSIHNTSSGRIADLDAAAGGAGRGVEAISPLRHPRSARFLLQVAGSSRGSGSNNGIRETAPRARPRPPRASASVFGVLRRAGVHG